MINKKFNNDGRGAAVADRNPRYGTADSYLLQQLCTEHADEIRRIDSLAEDLQKNNSGVISQDLKKKLQVFA